MRVDPSFERIARRLSTLQLRAHAHDDVDSAHDPLQREPAEFVGAYSVAGIRTVLSEYGLDAKLAARGLGDVVVSIHGEDAYRHTLELKLPDGQPVMDLRLHLCGVAMPGQSTFTDVVVVEWLMMQNPRAQFTAERPRLPGQSHPGTGLGRDVAQLLVLLCKRIGRAALVTVPEHFHLAELYRRVGWRAAKLGDDADIDAVLACTRALPFAERAWAVERGAVLDERGVAYAYHPHERYLLVDERVPFGPAASSDGKTRSFHVDSAWTKGD